MALHFPLMVNEQPIGYVVITRLNVLVVPGQESTYRVEVDGPNRFKFDGQVKHLYEDGALRLASLALAEVAEAYRSRNLTTE